MSNTNIIAELQRETQWLRTNRSLHQHGLRLLKQQSANRYARITELESKLATVMPLLEKLYDWCAEISGHYPTPEEDTDYLQTCEQVDGLLTAWHARQSTGAMDSEVKP